MATENLTQPTETRGQFVISDIDALTEASLKLHALLAVTYGEAGETFRNTNDEIQDAFMWACCDLARVIKDSIDEIQPA